MSIRDTVYVQLVRLRRWWQSHRWRGRLHRVLCIRQNHLSIRARETPDKACVIMAETGTRSTYMEVEDGSLRIARLFRACGLQAGDSIAFLLENHLRFFEICWAAQRSGLYFTPVNTQLTAREAAYIVQDCGARIFISSLDRQALARQVAAELPDTTVKLMLDGAVAGFESFEAYASRQAAIPLPEETEGRGMLYSSGTTGRPKGIATRLSGGPITMMPPIVDAFSRLFSIDRECMFLSTAPLYHAAPLGQGQAVQSRGGTFIVMQRFDAETFLRLVEAHAVTHANLVPAMFVRLLKLPPEVRRRHDLSSLRVAIHGAAPCPIAVKQQMIEWWGPVLDEYYAASEGNVFCFIDSHTWLQHQGSVGRPVLGPVHILDEDGNELPRGATGEIWSAAAAGFVYHGDPEQTARSRNARGWTTVGDIGHLDEAGYLYVTDRKDFTIISNGVNIYPREVEDILVQHPGVMDAAVFGVAHAQRGEVVKAVVRPVDAAVDTRLLESELIAFCGDRIARFKCPVSVECVEDFPRFDNGKLDKRRLRDQFRRGHPAASGGAIQE